MSIDERLRDGLLRNTDHLLPDLEHELDATYGRARVRRIGRAGLGLAVVAAIATVVVRYGDVPALRDSEPVAPNPEDRVVTDLLDVLGPLEEGRYSLRVWPGSGDADRLPRVVVDVPEGYYSNGGYVLDAGGQSDEQFGDIAVWQVLQVPTDPCRGTATGHAGTTVRDFARALVRQKGPSTRPEPVTIDGHPGLALEITIPPDIDLDRCTDGEYTLWRTERTGDGRYAPTAPGQVNHVWILDVDGTRLALVPGETDELHQEQLSIAQSVDFVDPGS